MWICLASSTRWRINSGGNLNGRPKFMHVADCSIGPCRCIGMGFDWNLDLSQMMARPLHLRWGTNSEESHDVLSIPYPISLRICAIVKQNLLSPNKSGTFSMNTTAGRRNDMSMNKQMSGNALGSANPFWLPRLLNGWQGGPPAQAPD